MSVPCSVVTTLSFRRPPVPFAHLPREDRRDRVRQRVVDVQQVEVRVRRDLRHLRRERQRVGRRDEERVGGRHDLVEVDALARQVQARGQRVGDEVDLVALLRERDPELRRDDAAAAEGRIAGDADLHQYPGSKPAKAWTRSSTRGGRRERNPSPNSTPIRAPYWRDARLDHVEEVLLRQHGLRLGRVRDRGTGSRRRASRRGGSRCRA